jgi:hypothetical protein
MSENEPNTKEVREVNPLSFKPHYPLIQDCATICRIAGQPVYRQITSLLAINHSKFGYVAIFENKHKECMYKMCF